MSMTRARTEATSSLLRAIRVFLGIVLAILVGVIGGSMVFSDLGPGESMMFRRVSSWLLFLLGGFFSGMVLGKRFWPLAVLCSWAPVLLGVAAARFGLDRLPRIAAAPFLLSLIGGYASTVALRILSRRRNKQSLTS